MSRFANLRRYLPLGEAIKIYGRLKTGKLQNLQVSKLLHPFNLRNNPYDYATFEEVILKETYNISLHFTPKNVIDAGGNIGLTAAYFATKYPAATIVSLEPDKKNFLLLQSNTSPYKNIIAINKGVWNKTAHIKVKDVGLGDNGFMVEEVKEPAEETITSVSISGLVSEMNWDHIDLLKIDVEGSEKEIFSENYEAWLPKTKVLIIELHDQLKKGCSKAVFDAIRRYNFSLQIAGENLVFINEDLVL